MKKITLLTVFTLGIIYKNYCNEIETLKNRIQFTTIENATKLLNLKDKYTDNWSQFDLGSRVHKINSTEEDQFKNLTEQIRELTTEEIEKINERLLEIDIIIKRLGFKLNFPSEIYLIKSSMKDEGDADGYTRGHSIILKDDIMSLPKIQLQNLLNGQPIIYSIKEITDFFEQVGKNTPYILDPEEILAENFVFALTNKEDLPMQSIVDSIQQILRK